VWYLLPALCWGSFLNVAAYRLVRNEPLTGRSRCPHCKYALNWYDLIPLLSWILLRGKCRSCAGAISFLYPLTELTTMLLVYALVQTVHHEQLAAPFILLSALIVNTRSDLETMYISRATTLLLIPVAWLLSAAGFSDLTLTQSIAGTLFGSGILYLIALLFRHLTHQEGLGQGDIDLIAMIGAFSGVTGAWWSLTVGSIAGLFISIPYLLVSGKELKSRIPFGPFLALGSITYLLLGTTWSN